jgi:DNA-directed RNA polymerase subunit RPC12/RpoP
MMEEKKDTVASRTGRTLQEVHLIMFSVALGLLLILGGLFIILFFNEGTGPGRVFGVPLIIGGLFAPHLAMRLFLSGHEISGPCPYCWSPVKTSDSALNLNCPDCHQRIVVRDRRLYRTEARRNPVDDRGLQDQPSAHRSPTKWIAE